MTESPSAAGQPLGLDVVHADDLLLDALGRGDPPPGDDDVAALLAAWRTDLADPPPPLRDAVTGTPSPVGITPAGPGRHGPVRRPRRLRLAVAAAVVTAVAGGTSVAAANATPDSPLWPITQVVNPERADTLDAESAIAQARRAVTQGRRADAQRLVDRAATLISRVRDPRAAARLRAELDEVRALLATAAVPGVTTPTPGGAPGTVPTPTPAPGNGGAGGGADGSTTSPDPLLPSLPLPVPLPTSIPPILPSLLPTGLVH